MRLHTNATERQVRAAVAGLDGVFVELIRRGSRTRDHAFDVHLVAEQRKGRRRSNSGHGGASYDYAATWDEWGVFFAALFAVDPDMTCRAYDGADDFHWQTVDRFRTSDFTPHDQHRWSFTGKADDDSNVWTYECTGRVLDSIYTCGAVKRYRFTPREQVSA